MDVHVYESGEEIHPLGVYNFSTFRKMAVCQLRGVGGGIKSSYHTVSHFDIGFDETSVSPDVCIFYKNVVRRIHNI